jgi:hypothetical protein
MECKRFVLGGNPGLNRIKKLPKVCVDDRTIYINEMKTLFIFKDIRPEAKQWIDETLPSFVTGISADVIRRAFWEMPQGCWYEYDFPRSQLSFSYLEKK